MPRISVIVPIYNAEPYLEQCLNSIQQQTLHNIEILCVNDGSTDNSPHIIEQYVSKDSRFKLINKANGGYGSAVNAGFDAAAGEYLAIVEPDDFIDSHMYEDLLAFSTLDDGRSADIIKASYWQYFDAANNIGEQINEPPTVGIMPKIPYIFNANENALILTCHPSVWSALYKRSFIEKNSLRFMERPGAGWVDNPFTFMALPAAKEIVWVPQAYYYYRITNALSSSSNLTSPNFIFERMRDIRTQLSAVNTSSQVWGAFYKLEFNYIYSITNEFGFNERDPQIYSNIREILEAMDESILSTSPFISHLNRTYRNSFLSNAKCRLHTINTRKSKPKLNFIVPLSDKVDELIPRIERLNCMSTRSFEVIAVDCSPTCSSLNLFAKYAQAHDNYSFLQETYQNMPAGINAALAQARGNYIFIYDLAYELEVENISTALDLAHIHQADLVLFDQEFRFVIQAMKAANAYTVKTKIQNATQASSAFNPQQGARFLFNCFAPETHSTIFSRTLLEQSSVMLNEQDLGGAPGFYSRLALQAQNITCYSAPLFNKRVYNAPDYVIYTNDPRRTLVAETEIALPGVLSFADLIRSKEAYAHSLANLVADTFIHDLLCRKTYESMKAYYDEYYVRILDFLGNELSGLDYYVPDTAYYLQLLNAKGLEGVLSCAYFYARQRFTARENEILDLYNSTTMRVGTKINSLAKRILPHKAVQGFSMRISRSK